MTRLAEMNAPLADQPPALISQIQRIEIAFDGGANPPEPQSNNIVNDCVKEDLEAQSRAVASAAQKAALDDLMIQLGSLRAALQHELTDWLCKFIAAATPALNLASVNSSLMQLFKSGNALPVEIRVHPSNFEAYSRFPPANAEISVIQDETLGENSIRAVWKDGELLVDPAVAAAQITSLLNEKMRTTNFVE